MNVRGWYQASSLGMCENSLTHLMFDACDTTDAPFKRLEILDFALIFI
jgi:hypothetical protein